MTRRSWIPILFLATAVAAQPTGAQPAPVIAPAVRFFGVTCGPASPEGSPRIEVVWTPRLGMGVGILLLGTWGYVGAGDCKMRGQAYLLVGASNQQAGGVPLPYMLPLPLTMSFPCLLQVSAEVVAKADTPLAGMGSSHASSIGLAIPNLPTLVGQKLYLQWLVQRWQVGINCPWVYPYFFTSNAAEITIGY